MLPFRIQPITLAATSSAFDARLLSAVRYLQVPEGRAFLLQQLRRRGLPLAGLADRGYALPLKLCDHPDWRGLAVRAAVQRIALALAEQAVTDPRSAPPPELDLEWPQERETEEVEVYIREAYTPTPIITMGNLFETLI